MEFGRLNNMVALLCSSTVRIPSRASPSKIEDLVSGPPTHALQNGFIIGINKHKIFVVCRLKATIKADREQNVKWIYFENIICYLGSNQNASKYHDKKFQTELE